MKNFIILLILVAAAILAAQENAYDTEINISSSYRSCNDPNKPYDYQYLFEIYHPNLELLLENDRELGDYHNNYRVKLMQKWEYVEVNALRLENETEKADLSQIDIRYRWNKDWIRSATIGLAQRWKFERPQTDVVIGKSIEYDCVLFLAPTSIKIFADTFTNDFKKFDYETRSIIAFELNPDLINNVAGIFGKDPGIPKVDLNIKTWLREFGSEKYWQAKMSVNIKL